MNLSLNKIFITPLLLLFFINLNAQQHVDLIIKNATIYTVDSSFSKSKNLIVHHGKIIDIGQDSILSKYESTTIIDASNKYIYPGFMDAHCHFTGYSLDQYKLNLYGTKSFDELVNKVLEYSRINKRTWIEGRLWDENLWENQKVPTKDTLDILFPNTPIFLMRIDGHAVLCNQKAFDLAGITTDTKIEHGSIELKNGKLTGIIIDKAVDIVKQKIPNLSEEDIKPFLQQTQQHCFELGLTSVVDCGLTNKEIHWIENAYKNNTLQLRNSAMLLDEHKNFDEFLNITPKKSDNFHIIGFKIFADGSLGSRGAYLQKDYHDHDHHFGYLLQPLDSIKNIAKQIFKTHYQLNIHAIGDKANHEILKIYADVLPKENDRRWRIEHAQMILKKDFHYFGDYNIIPSVQPSHAISDMNWVKQRIGKRRMKTAYAYHDLLLQNEWLPLGTDFPVESFNPLLTFHAAVFRTNHQSKPKKGFQIENALSREEALRGITIWPAKSVFEEKLKGSLEKGKFADFVILDIDLMSASPIEIAHAKVYATYLNGNCVYSKNN